MRHQPQLPDESVNVSKHSPLVELLRLGTGVFVFGAIAFAVTGVLVDIVVTGLPDDIGERSRPQIATGFLQQFGNEYTGPREEQARAIFSKLVTAAGHEQDDYTLLVIDNNMVNALAGPAHVVAVLRGLLDAAESENELAMVLGHELGHVKNKDPLRSLGRRIILAGLSAMVLGRGDAINNRLILSSTNALERRYSRRRELAADRYGLMLVCDVYGHRGGTADFFRRDGDDYEVPAFFSTHPVSERRIERLMQAGESLNCPPGDVTPLVKN